MPFKLTITTKLPYDNDGGIRKPLGYDQTHLYFHDKAKALEMADANMSAIKTCDVRFVQDAPGPFEDEPARR